MCNYPKITSAVLTVFMIRVLSFLRPSACHCHCGPKAWQGAIRLNNRAFSLLLCLLSAMAFIFFFSGAQAAVPALPTVTVMADHSIGLAVTEIARNYSRDKQAVVNSSFAPQKIQQAQISEGAAADILITSKATWIDELKLQGLVDIHSQTRLASDRLVLIGSPQTKVVSLGVGRFPTVSILSESNGEPMFFLGNPETLMEGIYAKEALRNYGVAGDLEPYTLYVRSLGQMFEAVVNQQAFGICFYSSVFQRDDIKIIDKIPESAHEPIVYYAVVIASDNMNEARNFLEYLKTREVQDTLKKYGLTVD